MSIRVGETGRRVTIITNFDMSANTSLTIYSVPPSGEGNQKSFTAVLGSALTNVTLDDGTVVASVAANESMYYDIAATTDFSEVGSYILTGVYANTNAAPDDLLKSAPVTVSVLTDNYLAP